MYTSLLPIAFFLGVSIYKCLIRHASVYMLSQRPINELVKAEERSQGAFGDIEASVRFRVDGEGRQGGLGGEIRPLA